MMIVDAKDNVAGRLVSKVKESINKWRKSYCNKCTRFSNGWKQEKYS